MIEIEACPSNLDTAAMSAQQASIGDVAEPRHGDHTTTCYSRILKEFLG